MLALIILCCVIYLGASLSLKWSEQSIEVNQFQSFDDFYPSSLNQNKTFNY